MEVYNYENKHNSYLDTRNSSTVFCYTFSNQRTLPDPSRCVKFQ